MMKSFWTALGNLFRKPATVKYPFEATFKPKGYRGLIEYREDTCIFCRRCELVCPAKAIVFSQAMDGKQTYHYNPYSCIYCGECVRACPKAGTIIQSEKPCPPALAKDNVSKGWFGVCREAKESRASYQTFKKQQQEQAQQQQPPS